MAKVSNDADGLEIGLEFTLQDTKKVVRFSPNHLIMFGSPARTPFGFAQDKLTLHSVIKANFFLRDQPFICRSLQAA